MTEAADRVGPARSRRAENALLFASCRVADDGDAWQLEPPVDWDYVVRAAIAQGVAPLVHQWLDARRQLQPAAAAGRQLQDQFWLTHFRNRKYIGELVRLSDAAAAHGVDILPIKGADLAVRFYPRPALRPMSDVDLLVRRDHLEAFSALLPDLGYEEFPMSLSYVDDGQLERGSYEHRWQMRREDVAVFLEFRAEPMEPVVNRLADLDPQLARALREHTDAMWSRVVSTPDGPRLAPADLLLHVAAHLAAKHGEFRLIWLHDVARIAAGPSRLDWRAIGETAARLQIAPAVRAACSAAVQLMAAPIDAGDFAAYDEGAAGPIGAFARWEQRRLARQVAHLVDADLSAGEALGGRFVIALGRLRGWGPRLRALRWAVLPSEDYLIRWPDRSGRWRGLAYAGAWLRRSGGAIARAWSRGRRG